MISPHIPPITQELAFCFLCESYQKHIHNKKECDLWTFHCSWRHCDDFTLVSVLEKDLQRHRLELSHERKDSPPDTWSLSYNLTCPLEDCSVGNLCASLAARDGNTEGYSLPMGPCHLVGVHTHHNSCRTNHLKNFFASIQGNNGISVTWKQGRGLCVGRKRPEEDRIMEGDEWEWSIMTHTYANTSVKPVGLCLNSLLSQRTSAN